MAIETGIDKGIDTLLALVEARAEHHAERLAYCFLEDDAGRASSVTYGALFARARAIAAGLQAITRPGDRVLLLCPPSLDYIVAFFGCILAGAIPVPAYPPINSHHATRIRTIVADAGAALAIADASVGARLAELGAAGGAIPITVCTLAQLAGADGQAWQRPALGAGDPAFLQYTSGSTSAPKGVVVAHGNLMHNLAAIQAMSGTGAHSRVGSWLPPYHDMGLIGCILMPAHACAPAYFLSPIRFIQKPMRWLEAISQHRITVTAAPNFGYEYCVQRATPDNTRGLDLRCWDIAVVGAEPVRPSTLARFAETFAPFGFDARALRPGYGLAEATLLVASGPPVISAFAAGALEHARAVRATGDEPSRSLVGIDGFIADQALAIVDPATRRRSAPGAVGEIWLHSPSVAHGYWNHPERTVETFGATLADDAVRWLRTGDLGFLDGGALYVTGRLKELIILRGANYYPQDFETAAAASHPGVNAEQTVAFSVERDGAEQLVIAVEVTRPFVPELEALQAAVRDAIVGGFGLAPDAVIAVKRGALPKTSSGKKERATTRQLYLRGELIALTPTTPAPRPAEAASPASPASPGAAAIERWLIERIAALTGTPAGAISAHEPFARHGLDSVKAVELTGALQDHLGRKLSPTLCFEFATPRALARHLGDAPAAALEASAAPGSAAVAIIGMGCRVPGAHGVAAYWDLLRHGVDAITDVPADRWDAAAYHDPAGKRAGSIVSRTGGFLAEVDRFDREFFGISPREAEQMDPQHRLLLQTVWEALENAGIPPASLSGTRTAVFVGISGHDYSLRLGGAADATYLATGNAASIAANRISYFLNLVGPSMAIDTACSSSLVAVQLACESLARGEVDLAIAAGANLLLSPAVSQSFSQAGILAADGRCKAFDHRANGIGRAEGIGVVVLKPLARAGADHVYAAIRGGAVNQDGRSNGLTAPNLASQVAVLGEAYRRAGIAPGAVSYVEAHGTGTALGDPIECEALGRVLSVGRRADVPCRIGSVKTNLGHLEAAAGVVGLIKVALAIAHRELPASLHYEAANPHIDLAALKLEVQASHGPWPRSDGPRIAGVSAFGFGGTNVHVVVTDGEDRAEDRRDARAEDRAAVAGVLAVSARSEAALVALAQRYDQHLAAHPDLRLDDLCYTAGHRRTQHRVRAALPFGSRAELAEGLAALARGAESPRVVRGLADPPRLAFVFSGQGSQWLGMGLALAETHPVFRAALHACADHIERHAGWSLLAELTDDAARVERDVRYVQPALFAIQVALAAQWRSWGIVPAAVIGHSMGEVAAAHVAGAIDLEDAVRIICGRSQLMAAAQGHGGMALVELSLEQALAAIHPAGDRVSVAAANGPRETILSGDVAALRAIGAELATRETFFQLLKVDLAGHSAHVEPARRQLVELLAGLAPRATHVPLFSTVTAGALDGTALDATYWGRNVREPVLFHAALGRMIDAGHDAFVELGPHPLLTTSITERLSHARGRAIVLPSMRRGDHGAALRDSLAALYSHGAEVAWDQVCSGGRLVPELPTYAWQTERCWPATTSPAVAPAVGAHPLLGDAQAVAALDARVWDAVLSAAAPAYLADHAIDGVPVFPGVGYLEMALHAVATGHDTPAIVLEDLVLERPLVIDPPRRVQATLRGADFTVHSATSHAPPRWERHAVLQARASDVLPALPVGGVATCEVRVDVDAFYAGAAARGLDYGPEFRRIRALWRGPSAAVGRIDLRDIPDAARHAAYPGVLDAALQVLGAAIPVERVGQAALVPTAIGRVHCLARLPAGDELVCHAAVTTIDRRGAVRGDLVLVTDDGQPWASITGVVLRRLAGGVQPDWFYQATWHAQPRTPAPVAPRELVVIAATRAPWAALAELLAAQGHTCTVLEAASADACARALAALPRSPHAILDGRAVQADAIADLPARVTATCADATALVHAIAERWGDAGPDVWLATCHAQPVAATDRGASLVAAPLWGLARAAMLEPGHGKLRLVDLDSLDLATSAALLAQDLLDPDGETQLAYRAGARFVARLSEPATPPADEPAFAPAASYLITGGLGGLGLEVAEWMVAHGARAIALLGRRAPSAEAAERIAALRALGARVITLEADVASRAALAAALDEVRALAPLHGVVHAAGVLDDGFLSDLTPARFARVLAPKVAGACHLHELTASDPLACFVLFSSAASLLGSPGQASYAAANGFLDALAHHRRAQGRPAISINWGPWSEVGLAASDARAGRLDRLGVTGLSTEQGLEALGRALASDQAQLGVVPLRAAAWVRSLPAASRTPYFALLARRAGPEAGRAAGEFLVEFQAVAPGAQGAMVERYLQALVAQALRFAPASLGLDDSLVSLGLDSITAVEIKNRIESGTGVALPILRFLGGATLRDVARGLRTQLLLTSIRADHAPAATAQLEVIEL